MKYERIELDWIGYLMERYLGYHKIAVPAAIQDTYCELNLNHCSIV